MQTISVPSGNSAAAESRERIDIEDLIRRTYTRGALPEAIAEAVHEAVLDLPPEVGGLVLHHGLKHSRPDCMNDAPAAIPAVAIEFARCVYMIWWRTLYGLAGTLHLDGLEVTGPTAPQVREEIIRSQLAA